MAGESISIPILTPGADAAARNIKQVGDAAAGTGAKLDFAAVSLKAFNDAASKAAKADQTLVSSAKTHAKALGLVDDAYRVLDGKATVTTKLLADQGRKFDDTGKKASAAAGGVSALAGTGGVAGGGMGALIAAGAVLSPVLVSLGVGAAGFGAAAYGIIKPIEKAAQATGGLQKNMHTLDAEQQVVARGILGLGKEYSAFQAALKPTVLHDFTAGLSLAGHLLHDVQPVAVAFGKAFGGFLAQLDKMFASGEWQAFFGFMARTVGPDLKLVGGLFVNLASDLPPLIVALQPVATVLLRTADALAATGRAAEQLSGGPLAAMENFGNAGQSIKDSSTGVSGFNQVLDILIGPQETKKADNFFHTLHEGWNILTGAEKGALKPTHDTVTSLGQWKTVTEQVVIQSGRLGKETDVVTGTYKVFAGTTQSVIKGLEAQAHQLNVVAAGYEKALPPLENYINAQIAERNDLVTLNQDLKKSHDAIGLKTAAERASFTDTQTFIDQTIKTGNAALAAHKGIQGQIDVIEAALPVLDRVKGKTAAYKQELDNLKGILDALRREKLIRESVQVSGTGHWSYQQSGVGHAVGPGGAAAGAYITGGVPGRDSVPIMAMPGEVVVPTRMVSAGAVDHLRGSIPGFAGGGVIPSYHGSPGGLGPWTSHNQQATVNAITAGIANSFAQSLRAFSIGGGGGGSGGSVEALARRMFPWPGYMWTDFTLVENREAGWNINARNPSSGAYGLAQFINGPSEYFQYGGNPYTAEGQLAGMFNYIRQRYGNPLAAWGHELNYGWYDRGGTLPPGWSMAYNGTGRPEQVIPGRGGAGAAGQTVIVNVTVGHGTHPVAAAQEIIKLLNQGAKSGVKLRSSILGPG